MLTTFPECLYRLSTAALLTFMLLICQELSPPSYPLTARVKTTSQSVTIPSGVKEASLLDFLPH